MRRLVSRSCRVGVVVLGAVVVSVALAGDVVVKNGEIQAGSAKIGDYFSILPSGANSQVRYGNGYLFFQADGVTNSLQLHDRDASFSRDVSVSRYLHVYDDVDITGNLDVYADVEADDDVDSGCIGYWSSPDAYFYHMDSSWGAVGFLSCYSLDASSIYAGKVYTDEPLDPPLVLYDRQSRDEIIDMVMREVPPEKQGGAALFFNKDTNKLEAYVASEGKFYDMQGNLVHALPNVVQPTTQYKPTFVLDVPTGQVRQTSRPVQNMYRVRRGYEVDKKTGQFRDEITGQVVAREEALEVYSPGEGAYYDLAGNLLRVDPNQTATRYVTEYHFDKQTGQVLAGRKAIRDKYVIKEGYRLDRQTGEFVDEKTGKAVPTEKAVRRIAAADIVAEMMKRK